MKKSMFHQAAALSLVLWAAGMLCGCCHTEVATDPIIASNASVGMTVPVASGTARNSGYYLFNVWPIYTGHPEKYNRHDYHAFCDDIKPEVNSGMLLDAMRKLYGAEKLVQVEHSQSSVGFFSLWIVWRRHITTTAIGMKTLKRK